MQLAWDRKYLGAQIGCIEVLHTWGQNLHFHPHIHCIVPGGGLNKIGQWVPSRKKFFIPVKVLSQMFRGKFLAALKTMDLDFCGSAKQYEDPRDFLNLIDRCYNKEWVVYCKPPFRDSSGVIHYLGRYTHRVAISNNRILNVRNGQVTFKWRDYLDHVLQHVITINMKNMKSKCRIEKISESPCSRVPFSFPDFLPDQEASLLDIIISIEDRYLPKVHSSQLKHYWNKIVDKLL